MAVDLLLYGLMAEVVSYPSSSFDVIAECPKTGKIFRVQVKSTAAGTKDFRHAQVGCDSKYLCFNGTRPGRPDRYEHIDIFAFVDLRRRVTLYQSQFQHDARLTGKFFEASRFLILARNSLDACLKSLLSN